MELVEVFPISPSEEVEILPEIAQTRPLAGLGVELRGLLRRKPIQTDIIVIYVKIRLIICVEFLLISELHSVVPLDELFMDRFYFLDIGLDFDTGHFLGLLV